MGDPFVVGLTDSEQERIREQFYVVEVFESSKSSKYRREEEDERANTRGIKVE